MINLCHDAVRVKRFCFLFHTILRKEIWKNIKIGLRPKPKRKGNMMVKLFPFA